MQRNRRLPPTAIDPSRMTRRVGPSCPLESAIAELDVGGKSIAFLGRHGEIRDRQVDEQGVMTIDCRLPVAHFGKLRQAGIPFVDLGEERPRPISLVKEAS